MKLSQFVIYLVYACTFDNKNLILPGMTDIIVKIMLKFYLVIKYNIYW